MKSNLLLTLFILCMVKFFAHSQTTDILSMSVYEFENDEHLSIQHFDSSGNCIKTYEYYDHYLSEINHYQYDAQNRLISHIQKDSTPEDYRVDYQVIYTYKSIDKYKVKVVEKYNDRIRLITLNEYNKKGLLERSISKDPLSKERLKEAFTYDSLGRVITNTATKGKSLRMTEEYKYNEQGFVIYCRRVYYDGGKLNEMTLFYDYPIIDERGNWLLRKYSFDNKKFYDQLKREIVYR